MDRRERLLRQTAKKYGCAIAMTRNQHWLITTPGGHRVIAAGSSGDVRSTTAVDSQIRRYLREEAG